MTKRECAVGAKRAGIKDTSFTGLTSIVSDGMKIGSRVLPGDKSACSNVGKFWGIIRGECAEDNSEGRWAG